MAGIFISYRREETIAYAGRLYDRLHAHFGAQHQVFMDLDTLQPGDDFIETLRQTVASCQALIAVIGRNWPYMTDEGGRPRFENPEDFVRVEIQTALDRKIRVIPALVGGARMPRPEDLPEALRPLTRRHAIEIFDTGFHQSVTRLIEGLERALAASAPAPPSAPAPAATLQPGTTRVNPKDGLTYVWIPPGKFVMGCSPGDSECFDDEKPAREVTIAEGFWLGQAPVTQEAFERVMSENPSHFKGPELPMESVDWNKASEYCGKIGGRLPREEEWEYAARAGTTGARYGPLDEIAWYQGNSDGTTHPVGLKQANAFGLYDMLGNVWEWTSSDYDPTTKVVRGGSWYGYAAAVRASYRYRYVPTLRYVGVGFRCVGELR
ncbi:MAG TPA: SUMF1/EgtB/PvdO family nonheme iron enzyme [Bryobacteraceae bacterium]